MFCYHIFLVGTFQSQAHLYDNLLLFPNTVTLNLTGDSSLNHRLMRSAACARRRHHSDHHTQPGCQRHCVDENLERRNHYLDLAGIENYTSRFGTGEWIWARGGGRIGGREKERPWPFEAASRGPHYCSTCLEPLGGLAAHCDPGQYKHLCPGKHNTSSVQG